MIRILYGMLGWVFGQVGGLFRHWLLFLIAALIVSPIGPHILWETSYTNAYGRKVFHACTYIGTRGLITTGAMEDCSLIAILDTRMKGH